MLASYSRTPVRSVSGIKAAASQVRAVGHALEQAVVGSLRASGDQSWAGGRVGLGHANTEPKAAHGGRLSIWVQSSLSL